jgi:hypothetical protein
MALVRHILFGILVPILMLGCKKDGAASQVTGATVASDGVALTADRNCSDEADHSPTVRACHDKCDHFDYDKCHGACDDNNNPDRKCGNKDCRNLVSLQRQECHDSCTGSKRACADSCSGIRGQKYQECEQQRKNTPIVKPPCKHNDEDVGTDSSRCGECCNKCIPENYPVDPHNIKHLHCKP